MQRLLLGAITLLALAMSGLNALATPFDFTYTGQLVTFTVPVTDTYQILAFGAQGGDIDTIVFPQGPVAAPGGRGAEIGGDFNLTAGEILQIAVGGSGMPSGGGGGGSFVVGPGSTPLVIAGGGGGGGYDPIGGIPGGGGLTGPNGGGDQGGTGGTGGRGGCPFGGGGGGGFFSAGKSCVGLSEGSGDGFPGLAGGSSSTGDGGFGGGGGAFSGTGGGGGGYSGGGGGDCIHFACGSGGGGSFDAGTNQILVADFRTGDGEVVITELAAAVPEPGSITLLGVGLAVLAAIRRRVLPSHTDEGLK